jgi:hypothetical protein
MQLSFVVVRPAIISGANAGAMRPGGRTPRKISIRDYLQTLEKFCCSGQWENCPLKNCKTAESASRNKTCTDYSRLLCGEKAAVVLRRVGAGCLQAMEHLFRLRPER